MSLFSHNTFLSVDIGTTSIKVGEFRRGDDGLELINYGAIESTEHLDGSGSALQTSSFRMLEPLVIRYLEQLIKEMKIHGRKAVVALPAFSTFTTVIELPKMSAEDTAKTIPFQSKQYIPAPLASVQIDWFPAGEREDMSGNQVQQVFIISTPRSTIDKYRRVLKNAGLKMVDFEVESVSLARVFGSSAEPTLIIDIGSRSTNITIAENGILKEAGQTDFAGSSLTQVLSNGLDITLSRAESLKVTRGLQQTGGEQGLSTLMRPMLDAIISEAVRIMQQFTRVYGRRATRAVLSGGGARLSGVQNYFQEELRMPVEVGNPLGLFKYNEALGPHLDDLALQFAVLFGAALKPQP